jgi:hypothetical protein
VDCPPIPDLNTPAVSFAVPTPPWIKPPLPRERGARGVRADVVGNPVDHYRTQH